jgi:hypothetical protein
MTTLFAALWVVKAAATPWISGVPADTVVAH